jgi:hypothetical protein
VRALPVLQILFLVGVTLVVGSRKAFDFFFQRAKWKGTLCFFLGIALVFARWPVVGVLVEAFGFVNLFGCVRRTHQPPTHAATGAHPPLHLQRNRLTSAGARA